jgi:hypothetical protein
MLNRIITGTDNNLAFVQTYKNGNLVQSVEIIAFTSVGKNSHVVSIKVSLLFFFACASLAFFIRTHTGGRGPHIPSPGAAT